MQQEFSIQPYLHDADILNQTVEQIKKDFSFFDITILFEESNQNAYIQLCEQILPWLKQLIKSDYQKLYALLYRVDISESQINSELKHNADKPFEDIITDLIIKRCLQKVVLRKLFSTHD
ncbi:MAG: hypothetical protein ACYDCN_01255 [Bacteroidia bacterium]